MANDKDNGNDKRDEREKMEVGGSGTAKASAKDAFEKDVKVKSVQWASSGSVVVQPDEKDPTSANFLAVSAGPGTIRALIEGEDGGHVELRKEIMALAKGEAAEGEIEVSVKPAPEKKKPEPAKQPEQAPAHSSSAHASTHAR